MSGVSYSNRATRYAENVVSGKIPACLQLRQACLRYLTDLDKVEGRWFFDENRADAVCQFAERMKHEKGKLQGKPFKLEDFQCWIIASIFGFVDDEGIRKYREAFVLMPRGNGKSPLAAIVALWMGFFDGEPGAEIYTGAGSEKQALEVFRPAKAMVEQVKELQDRFGIVPAAKSIYQAKTRSRFQPVIRNPRDGASVYCAILDEFHEALDAGQYDTFKTGANKRQNSLILIITTAGVTTDGPCHEKQKEVEKVLAGTDENDRLFGAIYTVDPEMDWTSPAALVMANPNLGISNVEESLLLDQIEATKNPAKQNIFRTKHLNVWCSAASVWIPEHFWNACYDPDLTEDWLLKQRLPCFCAGDFAIRIDMTAYALLFRDDSQGDQPHYYCIIRTYLPSAQVDLPENQHYQAWSKSKEGWLTSVPGTSTDWPFLRAETLRDIEKFNVREYIYDPWNADEFSQYISDTAGIPRVEVRPIAQELSPAMKELQTAILDGRFHHNNNPVLSFCMNNVVTHEAKGPSGNYTIPTKASPEKKIDAAVACFMAATRAMKMPIKRKASFLPFAV
jgi:phage terminase large subunit-like protein